MSGMPFPSKLPFPMGELYPHVIRGSLGPPDPTSKTASRSVHRFCTNDRRVCLDFTMVLPSPQNCPSLWGIWTPSNTWFHGPTRVINPNDISIGSAVFAELTTVTDRQTDHATRSVTIDRIYVRSTAMRPMLMAVYV